MKSTVALVAVIALQLAAPARADDAAARRELAPNGKLRVAIAVGPAPSALYAVKDGAGYRGVTIVLGSALAQKLEVPVEWVPYLATGEIQASAAAGTWDVSFMPVDEERKRFVDFGNAYHLLQSTYLVAPGSKINSVAEANAPGVRIAGAAGTATFRASNKASPLATHLALAGVDAAVEAMRSGQVDAIALSRESLTGLAAKIPGSRVLDGGFLNSTTAVAVPKGYPAALAYVSAFVEDAKASGLVRRALDEMGLTSSQVAPAGMKP
jgi:polar amino acid transport system substrate-binding protein